MRTLSVFLVPLVLSFAGCKHLDEPAHHDFADADAWAKKFEDPSRDVWQKPDEVIAALGVKNDSVVADIGSATGYFSVRLAKVCKDGHVYGADVESSMVDYLTRRADTEHLPNLTSHLAEFADPKLPEKVDLVLIVNTYHHIEDRTAYFTRLKASLKPGARLAIVDFTVESKMGPPPEAKVGLDVVEQELKAAGYQRSQTLTFLPEQFFAIFTP